MRGEEGEGGRGDGVRGVEEKGVERREPGGEGEQSLFSHEAHSQEKGLMNLSDTF